VPLVRTSASSLLIDAGTDSFIEQMLQAGIHARLGRASPAEQASWRSSLPVLARDLADAGLGRVEVLVEHTLPLTSKRADVILAGVHPKTRKPSYIVVELKQWSRATTFEDDPHLVDVAGMPGGPKLHPVAQVRGYCEYLADFLVASRTSRTGSPALPTSTTRTTRWPSVTSRPTPWTREVSSSRAQIVERGWTSGGHDWTAV